MKTQNNKLDFRKISVTELNDKQLLEVDGGTSPTITVSSAGCVSVVVHITRWLF